MVNISKFINEHIPLCVCTLGLAVLGYLGYHAVGWIISKCQRTEKIDQVAQKNINNLRTWLFGHTSKSLVNRVSNLDISPNTITMGQGEYVVFHKSPTGEKQPLSRETFEKVYQVLLQHSPAALANSGSEKATEDCANRYELIKAKLNEIDSTLEAVFVPRTLYELFFIRKCIKEDLKHKGICPDLDPMSHRILLKSQMMDQKFLKEQQDRRLKRKCWHLSYFTDAGNNEDVGVKDVAYRLNKTILKTIEPTKEGLTHHDFLALAEKEIVFLKAHYNKGLEITEKLRKGEKVEVISSCNTPGPTTNFGCESQRGLIAPMGIRNESDAQIIRNAIALECSKIAHTSLFLYRGADFQKDSTSHWSNKDNPYSLSYGSSLFAGCVYDGSATAFHYMRNGKNAYAVPVAFDQLNESPFFAPTTHTVAQLFGDGEIFHARTKAWKDCDLNKIRGVRGCANPNARDHLTSNLSQTELNSQFATYKNKAFQLK